MRARLPWGNHASQSEEHPSIELLDVDTALGLRLPWLSSFNPETLEVHLLEHPGHSLWVPSTREYAVAGAWRSRDDIAQLVEVSARRSKPALLRSTIDLMRGHGYKLLLLSEDAWSADPRTFLDLEFKLIERIVFFHIDLRRRGLPATPDGLPQLSFEQKGLEDTDLLLSLDHESFPWLWWNSREEFVKYIQMPDVRVIVGSAGNLPVGYASFTMYRGWAHLDRLAVISSMQGRGFGAAQLHHVLGLMRTLGAYTVNLSTQEDNTRSHRLYKSFGFRQTTERMSFYGRALT